MKYVVRTETMQCQLSLRHFFTTEHKKSKIDIHKYTGRISWVRMKTRPDGLQSKKVKPASIIKLVLLF